MLMANVGSFNLITVTAKVLKCVMRPLNPLFNKFVEENPVS